MSYDAKDFIAASVTRSGMMEDCGLKLAEYNGDFVIHEVGGVFGMFTDVPAGCRLTKLQDKDVKEYKNLDEIKQVLEQDQKICIEAVKIKGYSDLMNDSSISEQDTETLEENCPDER